MVNNGARLNDFDKSVEKTRERKSKGLCTRCGEVEVKDKSYCDSCLERVRGYKKKASNVETTNEVQDE